MDDLTPSTPPARTHLRVILAYDIADEDLRAQAAEAALDFIARSQLSVFDGWLPAVKVPALWKAVDDVVKTTEDEAFIVALCQPCASHADGLGAALMPDAPNTGWII
jgi:CRISPR-associated endonuclease Cas2